MKLFSFKKLSSEKGFTLIELLVVIGILGILAAALVATIDPFEQLKKANDANVKNTAVEFINANVRYYTTHSTMPWYNTTCKSPTGAVSASSLSSLTGCMQLLVDDGEIKSGFTSVSDVLGKITVSGSSNGVTACFLPESKAEQRNINAKFNNVGSATTGCLSQTSAASGGTACYWCSQ